MPRKPARATEYAAASARLAHRACLYVATKLGDLRDDVVVVGGLVPGLIIDPSELADGRPAHIGTMDVDLGLTLAIFDEQRYHELCVRLRRAGFTPDQNDDGRLTSQRWQIDTDGQSVTIDFLIPPTQEGDKGGALRNLEGGFAAIITPGLELAFVDKRLITLQGKTLRDEKASRELWVCEAGAFVSLKALAFANRGENKDAYDLMYVLRNYGSGIGDVYERLRPILDTPFVRNALAVLRRDFTGIDSVGTMRAAEFLDDFREEARADAAGAVRALLSLCHSST